MSVLDRFTRRGAVLPKNATFMLTQAGSAHIADFYRARDPKDRVLMALETRGSSSDLNDIAGVSNLSRGRVEKLLLTLMQNGYVQRVGGGGLGGGQMDGMEGDG